MFGGMIKVIGSSKECMCITFAEQICLEIDLHVICDTDQKGWINLR